MTASLRGGRYEVTGTLGEGAQAVTLEAKDAQRGGRVVAIKRFDVRGAARWKDVELAEREARVLASLDHPLLPKYVEHFEEGGALYLVMEKIDGESLAALRKRGAAFDERDVWRFLRDAGDALDYLHRRAPPLIHRDVKPTNVIRRPDGSFALVDFGAVREKLRPEGGSTVVGTFGYMAPEQFQGRALAASDVYAAGATALAMLTGHEPESLPHKGLRIDVRAALGGRVGKRLTAAIEAMTDPDPERRASRIAPLVPDDRGGRAPQSELRDGPRPSKRELGRRRRASRGAAREAAREAKREAKRRAHARRRAATRLAGPWRVLIPMLWVLWGLAWAAHPPWTFMLLAMVPIFALRRFATIPAGPAPPGASPEGAGHSSEAGDAGAARGEDGAAYRVQDAGDVRARVAGPARDVELDPLDDDAGDGAADVTSRRSSRSRGRTLR